MQDIQKIETAILRTIVAAYSSYYGRMLTAEETTECNTTISLLQDEIASRSVAEEKLVLPSRL